MARLWRGLTGIQIEQMLGVIKFNYKFMVEGEVPDSESEASRLFGAISAVIRPDRHGAGGQKISGEVVADGDGLLAGGRLLSPSQDLLDAVEGMDDEAESAAVAGARSECASKAAESLKPGN